MRFIAAVLVLVIASWPPSARAEAFLVQGAAGPTLVDSGHSVAAGVGFTPYSRLAILVGVERTHLSTELRGDGRRGISASRGGDLTVGSAELRASLFPANRITPYGVVGFAAGVSRPTVNDLFPGRVTNSVRAMIFGGGLSVPLTQRLSVFGDLRMMIGAEAGELLAVAPLRAGLAWRF